MSEQGHTSYLDLTGKRVVITGAASGIGLACAEAFAKQGCRLVLNDLNAAALDTLLEQMSTRGIDTVGQDGSIALQSTVEALFARADESFGGVDITINNAGISLNRPTMDVSLDDWTRAIDVNLTSVFLCSKASAARMLPARSGVILNLASMYGVVAAPERLPYCVSKSGVVMMTKALAIEWAESGVRVNAIAPGYVKTALVDELARAERLDLSKLVQRTPQHRLAQPDEIADLALFLASGRAGYITGQVVGVDGGWTAYGYI